MRFALRIAFRFLSSNKAQTLLIVLGIAIGVSVQVFIGSLIQGLQKELVQTTIGNSSQVTILSTREDKTLLGWEDLLTKVAADPRVTAVSPTASLPGFILVEQKTEPVLVRGFDLARAQGIYQISDRIYQGSLPTQVNQALVGRELQETLNLELGKSFTITTPWGASETLVATGFYDFGVTAINQSWIITDLATAQNIFALGSAITALEIQVKDVFQADIVNQDLEAALDTDGLQINNWKEQNQQLLSGLQGQSVSSIMIQVFVLIAVVLGIASVLAISVLQKSKQLGILKAMGVKDSTASLIFLSQGFLLGIMGGLLGVALGLLLALSFTFFAVNPDGTPVVALYISYPFIIFSALVAVLSATLAALVPAGKSSRLSPMEVIRNG